MEVSLPRRLQLVRYYLSYNLSYREIEEIYAERGINVAHSTLNRWVIKYAPLLEHRALVDVLAMGSFDNPEGLSVWEHFTR